MSPVAQSPRLSPAPPRHLPPQPAAAPPSPPHAQPSPSPLLAPSASFAIGSVVLGPTARRRRQRHGLHSGDTKLFGSSSPAPPRPPPVRAPPPRTCSSAPASSTPASRSQPAAHAATAIVRAAAAAAGAPAADVGPGVGAVPGPPLGRLIRSQLPLRLVPLRRSRAPRAAAVAVFCSPRIAPPPLCFLLPPLVLLPVVVGAVPFAPRPTASLLRVRPLLPPQLVLLRYPLAPNDSSQASSWLRTASSCTTCSWASGTRWRSLRQSQCGSSSPLIFIPMRSSEHGSTRGIEADAPAFVFTVPVEGLLPHGVQAFVEVVHH